ncbi:MAG: hypothetical protein L6Q54_09875 [Leptospiraceae bacterium]|nr:hypothetical protein [Leptospiraceae bacterium]MCK6381534.1 hypothetical protein [Leptospiraceae bacterium]NUM40673.1 hypothetical protein [Leptospiraceae bacterium]
MQKSNSGTFPILEIDTRNNLDEFVKNYFIRAMFHKEPIVNGYSRYLPETHYHLNHRSIQFLLNCAIQLNSNSPILLAKGVIVNKEFKEFRKEEIDCLKQNHFTNYIIDEGTVLFYK